MFSFLLLVSSIILTTIILIEFLHGLIALLSDIFFDLLQGDFDFIVLGLATLISLIIYDILHEDNNFTEFSKTKKKKTKKKK